MGFLHFAFDSSLAAGELQSSQQIGPVLCGVWRFSHALQVLAHLLTDQNRAD